MSFESALSGLKAAKTQLDVIGNNIANSDTTGFKESRVEFSDVFAASALGSSTIAGSGVQVSRIAQQFSQGNITFTDSPLDMAINGEGFFRLNNDGAIEYTRNGAFGVDKDGNLVSADSTKLTGYTANSSGNISGLIGDIQISTADLAPAASSSLSMAFNLNSSSGIPAVSWTGTSTFGGTVPASTTYNNTNLATVYDSLGNAHTLTTYFGKTGVPNTWDVRIQIDGVDVSSTQYSKVSTNGSLVTAGSLAAIASGDLTVNGTTIGATSSDSTSTSDAAASAIAIVSAINTAAPTGVTARVVANTLNLGTFTAGTIAADEFEINGTDIVITTATKGALLTAINAATTSTGVYASEDANGLILLTAEDGRNIQVTTDGGSGTATFSNFALTGGSSVDQVKRGEYLIESASQIVIAGTAPGDTAQVAGTYTGQYAEPFKLVFNTNGTLNTTSSDTVSVTWGPLDDVGVSNGSVTPQTITLDLSEATQFGSPFTVSALSQNGYSTGRLNNIDIDSSGILFGRYTNGQSQALGQVAIVNFRNNQGLKNLGNSNFGETVGSGSPIIGTPNTGSFGSIQSGGLEDSNVQLTEALVDLIEAQRGFQANAQTIRTEDAVTQTIINIR